MRCWHPTAAALWSRRWPFWIQGLVMGIYILRESGALSLLALTTRQVVAKREAVLYLNLEEYSGFTILINSDTRPTYNRCAVPVQAGGYNWMKPKSMISNWE